MSPLVKNLLAVLAGAVVGSIVNIGLIMMSGSVIPPPEGADVTTTEGLKASMHLMEPRHFIFPFMAHALGTFVGALVAAKMAATKPSAIAFIIGVFFLVGGIANVLMLPSPLWFSILDIVIAYIPMALLGAKVAAKK